MDEQPDGHRPSIPTWVWIVAIFIIILGLQLFLSGNFTRSQATPMTEFVNAVQSGRVDEIVVSGDKLEALKIGRAHV